MPKETAERTTSTGNCKCYCEGPTNSGCYCGWWVFFLVVDFVIGASRAVCDVCGARRSLTPQP